MKTKIQLIFSFLIVSMAFVCKINAQKNDTIKIGILIYPGVELLDYAGPADVFIKAGQMTNGKYQVFTFSKEGKNIISQGNGPSIVSNYSFENTPPMNILVIPGASMTTIDSMLKDKNYTDFLKQKSVQTPMTMSVCTGAYLLANTSRLNHKTATTHYFVADDFANRFPSIQLAKNTRYVAHDSVMTCSGVTSGINGALFLVQKYSGTSVSNMISRALQYGNVKDEKWPTPLKGMHYNSAENKSTKCIVCGMKTSTKINFKYKGKEYHFCSEDCKSTFMANPATYLK